MFFFHGPYVSVLNKRVVSVVSSMMEENQIPSNVDYTFQLEPVSSGSGEAVAEGEPAGK